ncbi:MAG: hypothetical protein ACOX5X_01390 [Acholeplasmataceae bacterium]|jgi:hypothetical protein
MKKVSLRQLILIVISIVLTGVTLATSIFAWFAYVNIEQPIIFRTGRVDVDATLYQATDPNYTGGPFEDSDYVLVTNTVTLDNLYSGQIFSFMLKVKNVGSIPGELTITLKNLPNIDLNNALILRYSTLNGTSYTIEQATFPTSDFIIGTKDVLSYLTGENEVILLFQIEVGKNLTNAHYGQSLTIDHIEVKLEQIPPSP